MLIMSSVVSFLSLTQCLCLFRSHILVCWAGAPAKMISFCKHRFAEPPPGMSPFVFRRHLRNQGLDAMKTAAQQGHMVMSFVSIVITATVFITKFYFRHPSGDVQGKMSTVAFLAQFFLLRVFALHCSWVPRLLSILGTHGITCVHVLMYGWAIFLYFFSRWGKVDGHMAPTETSARQQQEFSSMWASFLVRLVNSVFFETSGFFTVVVLELAWCFALWEANNYFYFQGDTCFIVAAVTIWRLLTRSKTVREFLTAKDSAQMQLSIGTLLNRVCDATVELNHEGTATSPAPQLAALLLRSGRFAEEQISTCPFVELVKESERKQFADHLISKNEELLLKQGDKSLPTAQLRVNLLDAAHASVLVDVYHVCFLGIDDRPRHLLGILEHNEDQRELSSRQKNNFTAETLVEETVDSGNESSNDSSSDGDITPVMPLEALNVSCWILPDSSDYTIRKATVLFNLLWGTLSVTCLRPQI